MRTRSQVVFVILAGVTVCADAHAIIRRHDREDARYLELAAKYPAVVRLGGGTATLVDPRWLLTAGHVAKNLSPFDQQVRFNDKAYTVEAIVIHPRSKAPKRTQAVDLAMIKLKEPVQGVAPLGFLEAPEQEGQRVTFVGMGMFGDGLTGPKGDDGKFRAATNTIAGVHENHISFKFDAPPLGEDLEGISGPGDSGGPALVEADGKVLVAGVSSGNDDKGAAGPCRYQSTEYYARVVPFADWIRETLASSPAPRPSTGDTIDLRSAAWPASRAGSVAAAFFEAYGEGSDEAMEGFEKTYRAESALKERPVAERVVSWRKLRAEWGPLQARKCVADGDDAIQVLVRAEGEGVWKSFRFAFESQAPRKLTGIGIDGPVAGE